MFYGGTDMITPGAHVAWAGYLKAAHAAINAVAAKAEQQP
jgi:hypothetical protein